MKNVRDRVQSGFLSKARAAVQITLDAISGKGKNFGYVRCRLDTNALPAGQKNAPCYMPVTENIRSLIEAGQMHEINTEKDPSAAKVIKDVLETAPAFRGLIFDPQPGESSEIRETMQLYADRYNMPVMAKMNGSYMQTIPSSILVKTNTHC